VREALAALPWVEKDSIQTDVPSREVRFNLTTKGAFNFDEAKKALTEGGFPEVAVKSAPPSS
jgi:hypothetical protein